VRDGSRAFVQPHLVAVRVITMMMRMKSETARLLRQLPDLRDDVPRARREVRIDREHVILKNYATVVAMALANVPS
jgi:hypothetical protein